MKASFRVGQALYYEADCHDWLRARRPSSVHGVVTDPPFGLEYTSRELELRRVQGNRGGVWRLPPSFDGWQRSPLPRFTVLTARQVEQIHEFFLDWASLLIRVLVPGAHVLVASTPLLAHVVATGIEGAGLEYRGTVVRRVHTMRGGDRPKGAHEEFAEVSVLPRAMHEPWLLLRKPLEGRIQDNLRTWGTGGLRRPAKDVPFPDFIDSVRRASRAERQIAPHPSLKPQAFLRRVVRGILPLGGGVVLDPFAGTGSTLAAALAVGYRGIGVEVDPVSAGVARQAIPALRDLEVAYEDYSAAADSTARRLERDAKRVANGNGGGDKQVSRRMLLGYDVENHNGGADDESSTPPLGTRRRPR